MDGSPLTRATHGFTIWFTGLPGAGKTTLAAGLKHELQARGESVQLLDGDVVRARFSPTLTYSKADRDLNVRRIGQMALLQSRKGAIVIAAAVSPYHDIRDEVRRAHGASFVEVYVECPIPELVRRDPKGLYAKALAGEIEHFTGVSDPYEPPRAPEITVHTGHATPQQSLDAVVRGLERLGLLRHAGIDTCPP